jgi:phosphoribosyl-ATP pyrophosphohydrolase/phosphoribosyl-AMP cyclohydrolase
MKNLSELYEVVLKRKSNRVDCSYTSYLFDKGLDKILKKIGEESAEVIIAAKNDDKSELVYEISDLLYHLTVLMVEKGVDYKDIDEELEKRRK